MDKQSKSQKVKKKFELLVSVVLTLSFCFIASPPKASAFVTTTGGDGYNPVIFQDKIFNIFHHKHISGDPLNPTFDIDCFIKSSGALCSGYPRYFSSTIGSSGGLGIGTAGTADISTSYLPHFSKVFGSRVFYAAQRDTDNGIGCFDLSSDTNCGYFQLGSIPWSGLAVEPAMIDGVVQEGNKLYSEGADMQMYCLDVSNQLLPVACPGQPYPFNTGITSQLPAYVGNRFEVPNNNSDLNLNKIFIDVNYRTSAPAASAQLTCFDSITNTRCAGWTSATVNFSGPADTFSRSIIHVFDPSGHFTNVCANTVITHPPQCFSEDTMASVPPPPNFLSGIISRDPPGITYVWDHIHSDHNTIYLAISAGGPGNFGEAYCYDFTAQNFCAGFGTNGVKAWDGLDGGIAVNGGATKDYGYAIDGNCMYGLGDAGVLWSFDARTGLVAPGALICHANDIVTSSSPNGSPKAPATGFGMYPSNSIAQTITIFGFTIFGFFGLAATTRRIAKR